MKPAPEKKRLSHEERKRLFEVLAMVVVACLMLGLSRLETGLFGLSERLSQNKDFFTSVVYFGLININVILILVLSFLVFRNVTKLVIERRRGVLGSRLRTKLVSTLLFFALAPTVLMFYVSTQFITTSFDHWFSKKVRDMMQATREAVTLVYKQNQRRLESLARIALQRIDIQGGDEIFVTVFPVIKAQRLNGFTGEYQIDAISIYDRHGDVLWSSRGRKKQAQKPQDAFILEAIDHFEREPGLVSMSTVEAENERDVVKGVAPIIDPKGRGLVGVIVTEERYETAIRRGVETILAEFTNLKPGVQLIRVSYTILLIVMMVLIIFAATWLGFYVARSITGPIQSLAEATREVALGNYDVTLQARTDDETGLLVRSFNQMTHDLGLHKSRLEESKLHLEQVNEELDRRRKYMEVVLRSITAGVIAIDAAERVTSVNRAAERLLGINAEKAPAVIGMTLRDALGEPLYETLWRPIAERLATAGGFNGELSIEVDKEVLTLVAAAMRLFDENGTNLGVVLVFDDATEQVKAQRVAAWREVARRIAHEIKNPLTPIKLNAQRLLRRFHDQFEGSDREVFESCIETILVQVDQLRDLVNEFSKFSRLPSVQTRPGQINDIIRDVTSLYRMSYPEVEFDVSGLGDVPQIPLDKDQMNRVFVNLIANSIAAFEHGGERGRIAFKTTLIPDIQAVKVEVVDNGVGIPAKLKDRVLEPYFSTKKDGTGLGLAIVNQIISDHGGYLRLGDHWPHGTSVVIELPLSGSTRTLPVG